MGMYQGGYGNFAAKRAARHGKTKQYKAALEQKQNSNNSSVKQVENTKNTPTESNKSKQSGIQFGTWAVRSQLTQLQ